jgi:hypothetical protein
MPAHHGKFVMASVAELEAGLISERTKAALKAAKARGVRLGRHGAEVLAPKFKEEARPRAMELEPVITELKGKGLSLAKIAGELRWRRPVEASGITRRWGTCCNVLQPEADRQSAGHWLPSRNDPALNRSNACCVRQGSFEPASEASPTDGGDPRHRNSQSQPDRCIRFIENQSIEDLEATGGRSAPQKRDSDVGGMRPEARPQHYER